MHWLQKTLIVGFWLCLPTLVLFAQAQSDAPVDVQVLQSSLSPQASGMKGNVDTAEMLQIKAVIQGQTYWLEAGVAKNGLLKPGIYPGKLIKDRGKVPYKVNQEWQLNYPDGKHENFTIVGIVAK